MEEMTPDVIEKEDVLVKEARRGTINVQRSSPSVLEHLLAGTIGGMSGVFAAYPLDTVRIRMQTTSTTMGPLKTAKKVFQDLGIAGFYRGISSPIVGAGLTKSAVFGGYGLCQAIVRRMVRADAGRDLFLPELGVAAMGSGLVASFVVTPIERIKVVLQAGSGPGSYSNAWVCARGLVMEQGVRKGLFAGLGPTLMREVPGYGLYFATYETCKRILRGNNDQESFSESLVLKTAIAGALAGMAAWLPVYPADVLKSRMQSLGNGAGGSPGILKVASQIWAEGGVPAFYHGLAPTLGRAIVSHSTTFLVYEMVVGWMHGSEISPFRNS
ncbi:unnamed protein product [Choristocarpus tenellus]